MANQFPNGAGDNTPAAPSITDATKWTPDQFVQWQQFQNQANDQSRKTAFQGAVNHNAQDAFKIMGSTRATFFRKEEKEEKDEKSTEERIIEHTKL